MSTPAIIEAQAYQYPDDLAMLVQFRRLHALQEAATTLIREYSEPSISGELMGMGVRVSPRQFPEILAQARALSARFGVQTPQIYIVNDAYLNAFTHGIGNQCFVAITCALLEQLDEAGLAFILGHEIGHMHCRHVLYTTMAHWLLEPAHAQTLHVAPELTEALLLWLRVSEITADRAGLLACGAPEQAFRTLLTLATGRKALAERVDLDEYLADQSLALEFNPVALQRQHARSHPYLPFRIGELRAFLDSPAYRQLQAREMVAAAADEPITIDLQE